MGTILGLDLGSNSIGWALLEERGGKPYQIVDLGSRIFTKAVEEKTPTPKNAKRRDKRLARRVLQRRARRKQRMLNYLVLLNLLPEELKGNPQPEKVLNKIGDPLTDNGGNPLRTLKGNALYPNPYELRAKALDNPLAPYELGRVLLHMVQRRGFLSNRKTLLSDMMDDPDVLSVLNELDEQDEHDNTTEKAKEETAFKKDISELRNKINATDCRTLGEYLSKRPHHTAKRNRIRNGGHLRTDRQMYQEELDAIWMEQKKHHAVLTDDVKEQIEQIIFFQRPLKLKEDRVGRCSLEPRNKRTQIARLEYQRFRYLQDINNLQYLDLLEDRWVPLSDAQKEKLKIFFETKPTISFAGIRGELELDKSAEFNLEHGNKKLKGNITACEMRNILPQWDHLSDDEQLALIEDMLTIRKKSALKTRLMNRWKFDARTAVNLCLIEFEPGYGSHSLKAIHKLLPFLEKGAKYSKKENDEAAGAIQLAGYDDGKEKSKKPDDTLGMPPEIPNPIVSKGLHELRRVVNAIIAEHGKPDKIRIEMARDLEMNTKRYKAFEKQQKANTKANDDGTKLYQQMGKKYPHLHLSKYPSHADKLKYRLWKDQKELCAYALARTTISNAELFSANIEIDHILPYSQSLDDSYMNKVVCRTRENRIKGQRTPIDAFGSDKDKWQQVSGRLKHWDRKLKSRKNRFYMTAEDVQKRDFISSQLNDTRYISKVALEYLKPLGADINVTKGIMTSWLRYQWALNSLIGNDKVKKDRVDHRHHTIDALVTACIDRRFYQALVKLAKDTNPDDIHIDPPWQSLRADLNEALHKLIVSHAVQKKLTDELHEDTGAGFIDGKGTVYRKGLLDYFDDADAKKRTKEHALKKLKAVVDQAVADILKNHMERFQYNIREAFSDNQIVFHKDGETPIKRVRIYQSQKLKTQQQLKKEKFGKRDKSGNIFKWYSYGNIHHIEVFINKDTGKVEGRFVTMMEAHRRAMTGTKSARKRDVEFEPITNKYLDTSCDFLMAIHKQSLVELTVDEKKGFYYVKSLGQISQGKQPRLTLMPHIVAVGNKGKKSDSIDRLVRNHNMKLRKVNAIGKLLGD